MKKIVYRIPTVVFVNSAGNVKEAMYSRNGRSDREGGVSPLGPLPLGLSWLLTWRCLRPILWHSGITIRFHGPKQITRAMLLKGYELFQNGIHGYRHAEKLYVSGAQENRPNIENRTALYLSRTLRLDPSRFSVDALTLDTEGNVAEFLRRIRRDYPTYQNIVVYLIDVGYREKRTRKILLEAASRLMISLEIISVPVRLRPSLETFKEGYVADILTEPLRVLGGERIKRLFGNKKRKNISTI